MDNLQSQVRDEQCGQRSQLFDECLAPVLGYIDAEPEIKQNDIYENLWKF